MLKQQTSLKPLLPENEQTFMKAIHDAHGAWERLGRLKGWTISAPNWEARLRDRHA